MNLRPINLREAQAFIGGHHRHCDPPKAWKFGVGLEVDGVLVGVGVAARPISRVLDDGRSLEIIRNCTDGTTKNAASRIYGALRRAGVALGFTRFITYTLEHEDGTSVRAAGFEPVAVSGNNKRWNRPARPRADSRPMCRKVRWESAA